MLLAVRLRSMLLAVRLRSMLLADPLGLMLLVHTGIANLHQSNSIHTG